MKLKIPVNSHFHSNHSGDAEINLKDTVAYAKKCGFKIITVTDHGPLPASYKLGIKPAWMKPKAVEKYLKEISEIKTIDIRKGIEIDYIDGYEDEIKEFIEKYDFDFVLGAIHLIDKWCYDFSKDVFEQGFTSKEKLFSQYFGEMKKLIQSGLFDCVAHIDLIKKFNENNKYFKIDAQYKKLVFECLELIKKNNMCLEINTSGLSKPVKEMYPAQFILDKAFKLGIDVTIGTDAHHNLKEFTRGYDQVYKALKKAGYDKIVVFKKRKKQYVKLGV